VGIKLANATRINPNAYNLILWPPNPYNLTSYEAGGPTATGGPVGRWVGWLSRLNRLIRREGELFRAEARTPSDG
jgi:hypothetical protein